MPDPASSRRAGLRELFDEIIELAPEVRETKIAALDLPQDAVLRLQAMLAFDDMVKLAPELRAAAMSALDLSDDVRNRLDAMLAADTQAPALLKATAAEAIERLCADDGGGFGQSLIGTCIGNFRLVELIGQGGSSVVFRAERGAGDGSQVVALKLLRTGLYSVDAQRRFRREQAILAQLIHPNIASLIEGGVSSAGIPYIAMELVDGVPITQAADARGLDVEQRLAWFSTLCRTIEAAHSALIVHRDLKPSNLLVTRDGDLKVLDFGIAKLVDNDEYATQTQAIALTPEYAAPEQFGSTPLTTAVDVYALGRVLAELLTGKRLAGGMRASAAVAADEGGNAPLPCGLPVRSLLARQLRGDLDAILANALAHEPAMRYRSAGALADDIDRYLAGMPVRAHPPSRWYQLRKFVARHRGSVAITTVFLLVLLTTVGVALWQADVARQQATSAHEQAQRAEAVRDLLVSVFNAAGADLPKESRPSLEDVVEQMTSRLTVQSSLADATRADLLLALAKVAYSAGSYDRALALLERADPAIERLYGAGTTPWLDARVLRASVLSDKTRYADTVRLLGPLRDDLLARRDRLGVDGLIALGVALCHDGRVDEGLVLLRQTAVIARTERAKMPDALLVVLINEAWQLTNVRRFHEGLERADAALSLWQQQGEQPSQWIIELHGTLALAAEAVGDISRAQDSYKRALTLADRFFDKPGPAAAWITGMYGRFLIAQGHLDEAEPYATRALELRRALFGEADQRTLNAVEDMGKLYAGRHDMEAAVDWSTQGIDVCRARAVRDVVCPRLLAFRGRSFGLQGRFADADRDLHDALDLQRSLSGDASPAYAVVLDDLLVVQIARHDVANALATADQVLAINQKVNGGMIQGDLTTRFHRASALFELERNDEALTELLDVEPGYARLFPDGASRFDMLALKARALARAQRKAEARDAAQRALELENKSHKTDPRIIDELRRLTASAHPGGT